MGMGSSIPGMENYQKIMKNRNTTFQVGTGSTIKYQTSVKSQGLLTNITGGLKLKIPT
jgi:hypothetical protein